jgi:hypothetical protein
MEAPKDSHTDALNHAHSFTFSATITAIFETWQYYGVFVPEQIADSLIRQAKHKRVIGKIRGVKGELSFRLALVMSKGIGYYLTLNKSILEKTGLSDGNTAQVFILSDPEPDALHEPEVWLELLAQDDHLATCWSKVTLGRKRGLIYFLNAAKTEPTRERRAFDLAADVKRNRYAPGTNPYKTTKEKF